LKTSAVIITGIFIALLIGFVGWESSAWAVKDFCPNIIKNKTTFERVCTFLQDHPPPINSQEMP